MLTNACSTPHATPTTVCLYRTFRSRHTRKYSSSRYIHTARRRSSSHARGGSIRTLAVAGAGAEARAAIVGSAVIDMKFCRTPGRENGPAGRTHYKINKDNRRYAEFKASNLDWHPAKTPQPISNTF